MDNMSELFIRVLDLSGYSGTGEARKMDPRRAQIPILQLRTLSFGEGATEEGVTLGLDMCPFTDTLVLRHTDLSGCLLRPLYWFSTLKSLHLGNSSFSQHSVQFQDGIVPILRGLSGLVELTLEKINRVDVLVLGELCPLLRFLKLTCVGSFLPVFNPGRQYFSRLEELIILNTRGAHVFTKTILQLLSAASSIKHLRFQFVDTLNDEVWSEILGQNPLQMLETVIFDQCHSISVFTLDALLSRNNALRDLCVWSCRFIMEDDQLIVLNQLRYENFNVHFDWYPYTGEEAPMPLEDIEEVGLESDDEEEAEEDHLPEFMNYWNNMPPPNAGQFQHIQLD